MPSSSSRERLPFEPRQKKKKSPKQPTVASQNTAPTQEKSTPDKSQANLTAIPAAVSKRMIKRMALLSGIPTGLGMLSFVAFYWIVSHNWIKIPTYAVGAVSLGLFGLGVVGLSYGIFSTSWDEDRIGGWVGWEEFKLNFGRMVNAWQAERKAAREAKSKS